MDAWVHQLKDAFDAGYYRTEPAEDAQTPFPWQFKTCRDCPFWSGNVCQVHAEYRSATEHSCSYFDHGNHQKAQTIIRDRQSQGFHRWWQWFNDQGAAR